MKYILPRLLLCLTCLWQAAFAENKGPQTVAELQTEIEKVLQRTGTPGAAVAIVSSDKVEWMSGIGLADVATKKPVTTRTVFRVGSVSKKFVALAALKLQEEGKLKLTDTLQQWLPEYTMENPWEATDPVRLVHLLEHTSGIPDWRFNEMAHNDPTPVTLAQALAFAPQYRIARWRPGSRRAYSNVGPSLVAAVIEKATGQRFEDYVRDNFFVPLHMESAGYFLTPEVQTNLTTMYWTGGKKIAPYRHVLYRPAAAVSASIEDMANFVRFHLQRGQLDGRRILRDESMDRLEMSVSSLAARAGVTSDWGLCDLPRFDHGYEWHGYGGWWDGARCWFFYNQELGLGAVVMTNSSDGETLGQIIRSVGHYAMRSIPARELPPVASLSVAFKKDLEGYYANIAPRDEGYTDFSEYFMNARQVRLDEKGMLWRPALGGSQQRWVAISDKLFRRDNASKPAMALITGEKGELQFQTGDKTFQRISGVGFWSVVVGVLLSIVLLLTAMLFALVWGLRKAFGRLKNPGPLSLRVWPLVGAAGLFGFIVIYASVQEGCLNLVGTCNAGSIGIMLVSLLIPLGTIFSVAAIWRHRRAPINRVAYWHAVLVTLALVFMTGFGLCWGLIGIRTWA